MAITLYMDTAKDSMVELYGAYGKRATRTGVAHDLPETGSKTDVLWNVIGAVKAQVGTTWPGLNDLFLVSVKVFGTSQASAAIQCIYDGFNGVASGYFIEAGATMSSYATNMLPGRTGAMAKRLFKVEFTPSGGSCHRIPPDLLTIQMLRPIRKVSTTIIRSGTLDDLELQGVLGQVGWVNDAPWMGQPIGAWLTTHAAANVSKYQGYYTKRLEAISQGNDLWRYFGTMQSSITGRRAVDDNTQDLIDSMNMSPYMYGIDTANGLIMVSPYETRNYPSMFGF